MVRHTAADHGVVEKIRRPRERVRDASCRAAALRGTRPQDVPASARRKACFASFTNDGIRPKAFGGQQRDLSAPGVFLRRAAILDQGLQTIQVCDSDKEGCAGSHATDPHAARATRIPKGIQMSDLVH